MVIEDEAPSPPSNTNSQLRGVRMAQLLLVVLFPIACYQEYYYNVTLPTESMAWEEQRCVIREASLEKAVTRPEPPYVVQVQYDYEYDGEKYSSHLYELTPYLKHNGFGRQVQSSAPYPRVEAERLLSSLAVGSVVPCFVDPTDARRAILEKHGPFVKEVRFGLRIVVGIVVLLVLELVLWKLVLSGRVKLSYSEYVLKVLRHLGRRGGK